ncbi:MAG TPA: serine hydrolase [Candidatus Sulfotelmatobacter sp.]|nr:serine hydrolase [Candidatus Sulfotelmatobacter sp.]
MRRLAPLLLAAALVLSSAAAGKAASGPVFSDSGPDAQAYGADEGYPVPPKDAPYAQITQKFLVGHYSHFDRVRRLRTVPTSPQPSLLKRASAEIRPVYGYDRRIKTIANYLHDNPATGLLIARGDTVLYEHYQYGRTDHDRFLTQSMAKTVTGLLVGIALSEGAIHSLADTAATYVPELAGTGYGATSIRALLQMSSGIAFQETYQPGDDSAKLIAGLVPAGAPGAIATIRQFDSRVAPPGTRFNYSSADSEVLGLIVSRAVHEPLAQYLSERIWQKLGAEADAGWLTDPSGQELSFCCMVARLRDWARLGLMLANDGKWNGRQIVPRQWILDSTTVPADSYLAPGRLSSILGYGYQVWISYGERRRFSLLGIHGQSMLIDPVTKLVLVTTAVRPEAAGGPSGIELADLWYAVLAQYGDR